MHGLVCHAANPGGGSDWQADVPANGITTLKGLAGRKLRSIVVCLDEKRVSPTLMLPWPCIDTRVE